MARVTRALMLSLILLSLATSVFAQSQAPTLTGVVTDYTQTLTAGEIQEIEQQGQQTVARSANRLHRIYVLLTPNLYGYSDSNEFGRAVFDANGLGTGDVLITIEFDSRALVLTNSSELDGYFLQNAPTCQGDWGTYVVNDVLPGHLGDGDFTGGIKAAMQEIGRIVTQAPKDCTVSAAPIQPMQPVSSQPVPSGPDVGLWLFLCVIGIIVVLVIVLIIGLSESGGYVSTSGGGYSSSGGSYSWPSSSGGRSSGSSSRSGGWSPGGSSSRSSVGSGGSSSRSSFSGGGSSSRSSSSSSSSRSGKW